MLWTGLISGEVRQVDLGLIGGRELLLGFLSSFPDSLEGQLIASDVHVMLTLELFDQELLQNKVEVLTSKRSVTVGSLDLKDTTCDLKDGDIEGATTKVVDSNDLAISLVETEGKGGSSRLVDDSLDLKVGDLTSILGSLSLRIVEVSRHSDDSLLDVRTKVALGSLLHLHEDEGSNLLRRVLVALGLDPGVSVASSADLVRKVLQVFLGGVIIKSSSDESL